MNTKLMGSQFVAIGFICFGYSSKAQLINWHHLDLKKDGVFGVSSIMSYNGLLKDKTSNQIIVAVIDSGTDSAHADLSSVLWTNSKDGSHGWNYIGPETGKEDVTHLAGDRKNFYDSLSYNVVPEAYRAGYQAYRKMIPALQDKRNGMKELITQLQQIKILTASIVKELGKEIPSVTDFKEYRAKTKDEEKIIRSIIDRLPLYKGWKEYVHFEIDEVIRRATFHLEHGLNISNNEKDTAKGNNDVSPDPLGLVVNPNLTAFHGTHVAGIIAAKRNNNEGMNGIADNVKIMTLKVVGNIRELREKNLAAAIRFAVDHGAKIVNMSFGKPYTLHKQLVDDAIAYAFKKDVLLVHAAGNSGENLDEVLHYPNPINKSNWIVVGASGPKDDESLKASFSNYGQKSVDVFAPGVGIYSTVPGSKYQSWDGTSMAAPVVTGIAALIREYYPKLTAVQVKEIIMKSVVERPILADKCVSGGVANAYNALKLAATYK